MLGMTPEDLERIAQQLERDAITVRALIALSLSPTEQGDLRWSAGPEEG